MKNMFRNTIIFSVAIMMFGCNLTSFGEKPSIAPEKVVINEKPEEFLYAYDKATKECKKGNMIARYIPDESVSLEQLTFECVDPNAGEESEETVDTAAVEDTSYEDQVDMETETVEESELENETDLEPELTEKQLEEPAQQ
jgi:hypothetical protein